MIIINVNIVRFLFYLLAQNFIIISLLYISLIVPKSNHFVVTRSAIDASLIDNKMFAWTSELSNNLFNLRFDNDWLFKAKKQPWGEFHKILLENGFPPDMTVDHVRKKWSYNCDMYRIAKKTNNRKWKHFKLFDKHFGKSKTLEKYESWNDEWRLKLIICISEAKDTKMDMLTMWRTVESAMRCQDLPIDCCIQDIQGLWHHIRMIFNRKHRQKLRKHRKKMSKGVGESDWLLYDAMLSYYKKFESEYFRRLEIEPASVLAKCFKGNPRYLRNKDSKNQVDSEFQWSKDITESFIQIRLQHDWLFKKSKWAWNELARIMIEEYGFPKTLTSREVNRKWAATFAEYQKAKATNNTAWVYYHLFEVYLGESNLSLNPLVGWQEEWVLNLINIRTDLEDHFRTVKDKHLGWRDVEKRLRNLGLPLDHSLLELEEIWTHLLKTFRWKRKFATKGILNEQWPYFNALNRYTEIRDKLSIKLQIDDDTLDHFNEGCPDDDDDVKLVDLKKKLEFTVEPKVEVGVEQCRSCSGVDACVDIFEQRDGDGIDLAQKLKIIAGVEVDRLDNLPSHICLNCQEELQNAFKFRRKCQDVDKQFRYTNKHIKVEVSAIHENETVDCAKDEQDINVSDDIPDTSYDIDSSEIPQQPISIIIQSKPKINNPNTIKVKVKLKREISKKSKKVKYNYGKMCEICGKYTKNLVHHLDTHTTNKAYGCDVCDKKFKFKSGLLIHKASHNPTPRKTCEVCGKTFHQLAQYRRHFVYHANERKYACDTCGKRFNTLEILRVHNRIHTDERPFPCKECDKTFRTAGCVSRHRRIVHKNVRKV